LKEEKRLKRGVTFFLSTTKLKCLLDHYEKLQEKWGSVLFAVETF
jgi:hypothetical protein